MKNTNGSLVSLLLFTMVMLNSCEELKITTGIEGTVYRGPINPVEILGEVNDLPFSAKFYVYNKAETIEKVFTSDVSGMFIILLAPGDYRIVPDSAAPIMHPQQQSISVTVNSEGITKQDLYFDTGIR